LECFLAVCKDQHIDVRHQYSGLHPVEQRGTVVEIDTGARPAAVRDFSARA